MDSYISEIKIWAGAVVPNGWRLCDGTTLPISESNATELLYSLIGNTYGGDGNKTFALPDFRGRLPVGVGKLPSRTVLIPGANGGSEAVSLGPDHFPQHSHPLSVAMDDANAAVPDTSLTLATLNANYVLYNDPVPTPNLGPTNFSSNAIGEAGSGTGNGEHPNMMSSLALNFIICVDGYYPMFA